MMAGFFSKLFRPIEAKESRTGSAMVLTPGQPVWSGRDYKAFADEAYRKNNIAFKSINTIADAVASVHWTAWRGETELTDHPVLELIRNPNPAQSGPQYMRAKVGFFLLSGNGYEERVRVGQEVRELYQLRPDRMKIIPGTNGFPQRFVYDVNGRKVNFDVDPRTLESDVRHLKTFNPTDDWYGMSPIEAGAYAVDQHNEAAAWVQGLLQNAARPSGALVVSGEQSLNNEAFNRLKVQMDEQYSGARNAGRPMLLEGGLDWKEMGLSPVDMQLIETKYSAARDIALSLGVPPQLLGIPGDNTYSNYQEARLAFWEDTVIPLLDLIAADWSEWLGAGEIMLKPDLDQVPAIVEKKRALWDMVEKSTNLTINEKREAMGYEPIDGGDTLFVPMSSIPLTLANEPPPPIDVTPPEDDFTAEDAKALAYGIDSKVTPIKSAK